MVIIAFILLNALFKSTKIRLLFIFLLIWFTFYVIILSSKAGIVCLLIIAFFLLLNLIIKRKLYILSLIIFFVLISFVIVGIKKFPMLTDRVNTTIQAINSSEKDINKEDGTVQRIEIWKTSITLIKENFLIGVGTGDVKDALLKSYDEKGMTFAKNKNLNAHSQYFQTFITLGIIGFLILLSLFIFPLIHAFKNRNFIYLFFLLIVAINIAVESMFENQAGVVFYTFFNSFLFLTGRQLADKNKLN
ncbi:MAG: O-antigen ligase family protein [Bacteroidetes bacterium]|nr:O-antigen ligase family protein [Bacteroidota bacterium]